MKTTYRLNSRTVASSALAVVLALSSTAALGRAMSGPGEDDSDDNSGKTQACAFIGCPNGNRVCGTASGKISGSVPPFTGEISVSWTCYESGTSA